MNYIERIEAHLAHAKRKHKHFADARANNQEAEDRREYGECERRTTAGYCTPCKFDCKFYSGGRCAFSRLDMS